MPTVSAPTSRAWATTSTISGDSPDCEIPMTMARPSRSEAAHPGTLHETLLVQGNQVSIGSRRYFSFAMRNPSYPGRYACCHSNCLRPSESAKGHDIPDGTVERQNAASERAVGQPYRSI